MKNNIAICVFVLVLRLTINAQERPARLIIRGDDMGFCHSGNAAVIKTFKEGIERSIEVIVPSPWFPEAVKLLKENPGVDVGVHLALTSEWENIKWRPLTYCQSLTDSDGYFYPMIWPNKNYPDQALKQHAWKLNEIENEFRAQIEMAIKKIPRISHVSAHMGCTDMDTAVNLLVKRLTKEYNIDIDLNQSKVQYVGLKGPSGTFSEKLKSFLNLLEDLKPGETYLFIEHPALDNFETRAIYLTGDENVAVNRQDITNIWTNAQVRETTRKKNIQLISYADLKKN